MKQKPDDTPLSEASMWQLLHALLPAFEPISQRLSKAEFQIRLALQAANEGNLEKVKNILSD